MVSRGETYVLKLYKRIKNSSYEYEDVPSATFHGRPAKPLEKNSYTFSRGIVNSSDDTYVFSSNMPEDISDGDRIEFLGKLWSVTSVGVYFEQGRFVNAGIMDSDKLMAKCPKGITLK